MQIISDDIFENWKGQKFIIADRNLHDSKGHLIILTDYIFWTDHFDKLETWCNKNGGKIEGMTVNLPTDKLLTAFLLKWT